MSGGEQQRIAIACAIANNPSLLLADEPTGELDTNNQKEILKIFKTLIEIDPKRILIIVTHDPRLQAIANRVLYIRDGEIIFEKQGGTLETGTIVPESGMTDEELLQVSSEMEDLRKKADKYLEVKEILKKLYKKLD
jgi:ABC-type glutathione transport system ATPase component